MDYVYDIVVNFQDKYYDFYEWNKNDKIINIRRIPLYKINNKDYYNIKIHDTILEVSSKYKMFLVMSSYEVMGIIINDKGRVVKKSSLLFEESDDIIKHSKKIKETKIKYKIIKYNDNIIRGRVIEERENYIKKYINNNRDNEYLLKYIYYDIYNKNSNDIIKIYQKLLEKDNINKVYYAIKNIESEIKRL